MDAQNTINEVVEGMKSEGLFDQFRKESLDEFDNMETYHQLKQRVENHVTSFLSKHKFHDGLQKNALRSNLRSFISKSDVLLNGIAQLVDEVLSLKGKSFCLRIDKHVDKHLCKKVPVPSPVKMEPPSTNNLDKPEQSNLVPLQNDSPMDINDVNNANSVDTVTDGIIVEEQKEILSNNTVTEFTEMEIEEVEMDLSENQEVHETSEVIQINEVLSNDGLTIDTGEYTETHGDNAQFNTKVKIEEVSDIMEQSIESSDMVRLTSTSNGDTFCSENEIKIEPEDLFQPIVVATETVGIDIVVKEEPNTEPDPAIERNEYERIQYDNDDEDDVQSSLNLPPIITEPITDDSDSNDSTFADNIKAQMNQYMTSQHDLPEKKDDSECRRKSSRVRTLPLKFREIDEVKKLGDDADSVSSNDVDYKDLEDGTCLTGKRGRPRKRPQSAGIPETAPTRNERRSSLSRTSVENDRRRKHSPSISKQEEEAINFLTKADVRKSLSREGTNSTKDNSERNSRLRERNCESREARDGNTSDKDEDDRYSRSCRKSESKEGTSEKDDWKSKRDRKTDTRDGSSSSKDEDVKNRRDRNTSSTRAAASNKDEENRNARSRKSESGEGGYSSVDDDDQNSRNKRDKNMEPRESTSSGKDSEDRKSRDRREHKSSGSGKDEERSTRVKRENKSDTGKEDPDRKSRTKREETVDSRQERDPHYRRKRFHSPTPTLEDSQSKRSRRSIKQRQRYSPP